MRFSEGMVTLAVYLSALAAVGGGIGCAISAAWASVVVGGIVLGTVFIAFIGGRKE